MLHSSGLERRTMYTIFAFTALFTFMCSNFIVYSTVI